MEEEKIKEYIDGAEKEFRELFTDLTASEVIDALLAGKMIRRKTWEKGQYVLLNDRGDIVNQNGDCCYLPLIQCERASGASSADQARALRSELCLKLWEEAK